MLRVSRAAALALAASMAVAGCDEKRETEIKADPPRDARDDSAPVEAAPTVIEDTGVRDGTVRDPGGMADIYGAPPRPKTSLPAPPYGAAPPPTGMVK